MVMVVDAAVAVVVTAVAVVAVAVTVAVTVVAVVATVVDPATEPRSLVSRINNGNECRVPVRAAICGF